jgi:hypothetical protein
MSGWLSRPGYLVAGAFLAGIVVAAIVAVVVFVSSGDDDDDGGSVVATSTPGGDETPSSPQPTSPDGVTPPAATPTLASARTPDDALAALISEQLESTYVGPCPETPGATIPQGLCSVELYRSAELVTFLVGQPFSEGVGEAIITANADGTWSVDFVRAPEVAGPQIAIGSDAMVYGAGDCLRFREEPDVNAEVITCQLDGTRARVTDGPVEAGGQTWWELEGLGWGSAAFLVRPGD